MSDYDLSYKPQRSASDLFFTNATIEIGGVSHQICVKGPTAAEMTTRYFDAVDTLTAAYAARSQRSMLDMGKLFTLLQCGMDKAAKAGDMGRAQRLVKGAALVQSGAVERIEGGYDVRSQTDTSKGYFVNTAFACTCEDWERHASQQEAYWCKHSIACCYIERLTTA